MDILGSIEKIEYRCTTTNLPLCNDIIIIIVLKITPLHSVLTLSFQSMTNKKPKKHHTFSSTASVWPTIPP